MAPGEARRAVAGALAGLVGRLAELYDVGAGWSCAHSRRYFFGGYMHRKPVNKHRSAQQFKRNVRHTKAPNMKAAPMRGGIRL